MSNAFHGGNGHSVSGWDAFSESEAFRKIKTELEKALDMAIQETNLASAKAVAALEKVHKR